MAFPIIILGGTAFAQDTIELPSFESIDDEAAQSDPFLDYPSKGDFYVPQRDQGYYDKSVEYLKRSRESISDAVTRLGRIMDHYFAGEEFYSYENESYLSIRVSQRWFEGGKLEPEYDYKFRIDLPGAKERYRLVLEYDDDDSETLEQRSRPSQAALAQEDQSLLAAVAKNLSKEGDKWDAKIKGGIKLKLPPDPFVRMRAKRDVDIGELWELELRAQGEWRNSNGWHNEFDITFDRVVYEDFLLRFRTSFDWRDEKDTLEMGQRFSLYQTLSDKEVVEYQLGFFGESLSEPKLNTYYVSAFYRSQAYKDWFFIEIIPELAFERDNGFSGVASITAAFEIFFHNL